ncbi:hypothetical protein ACQEVZ_55495 [Dactylosporangium sp. CA-152071]|uniref:hypothetical protein n=1 Tax=Dactylosporangium sp. CA-152071 TaxID=3239933 RepID=UPI003D8B7608
MNASTAWTIAVADTANLGHPSPAYVVTAAGRAEAIESVTAQHTATTHIPADRVLIVDARPGTPPADACDGWSDLRGVTALRIVVEPGDVRRLARLRLRLRRWQAAMHVHAQQQNIDSAAEIPPPAWHEYLDEAEAITETLAALLLADRGRS